MTGRAVVKIRIHLGRCVNKTHLCDHPRVMVKIFFDADDVFSQLIVAVSGVQEVPKQTHSDGVGGLISWGEIWKIPKLVCLKDYILAPTSDLMM